MRDLKKNVNFLILTDSFGNTTSYNGHWPGNGFILK
jgi:hypothetical protein